MRATGVGLPNHVAMRLSVHAHTANTLAVPYIRLVLELYNGVQVLVARQTRMSFLSLHVRHWPWTWLAPGSRSRG